MFTKGREGKATNRAAQGYRSTTGEEVVVFQKWMAAVKVLSLSRPSRKKLRIFNKKSFPMEKEGKEKDEKVWIGKPHLQK